MEFKEFIGKTVISKSTNQRYIVSRITSPYIEVKTEKPNSSGYPSTYCFETINSDPISNGVLTFEDVSLNEKFVIAYNAYCNSKDAYYEDIDYWMRKD